MECTPPDSDDRESQEDETEQPEDRRKTLITVNLSALSMPVQDDDPYEDEEEEDQESDELVVVEDKPYISHKQAQSVRLLGILENIERRVCFAPRAPHLTLPPGAPGASEPSRPRTSPFLPSRPGSKDGKTKCPKAMRAAAYYSSRPTTVGTGSDAGTRPATVDSKKNQTPGMTRITSPVKPQWVWASGTSIYRQAQHRHFHDILMTPAKVRRLSANVYPLLMASHSFWKSGHILLQHASAPHSNLCISDRSTTQATFIKDVLQSTAMTYF